MSNIEYSKMSDRIDVSQGKDFLADETVRDIKTDFMGRLVTITIAGLGLITALAWDRTLEDIFTAIFGPLTSLSRKITYALVITLFAVLVTIVLRRFFIIKEEKKHERRRRRNHS